MAETKRKTRKLAVEKVVTPLVAAATTAAVRYLVRKGPHFVERTLVPKLRQAGRGARGAAGTPPGSAGDVAETLTKRARSAGELERGRKERAKHRAARRNSTS
jgi:hypothetical protein